MLKKQPWQTKTNKQIVDFINSKTIHQVTLKGDVIDESPCLSLAEKVFSNLSGENFANGKPHAFSAGHMTYKEYLLHFEKRVGVKLKGELKLIHRSTGDVIKIHQLN